MVLALPRRVVVVIEGGPEKQKPPGFAASAVGMGRLCVLVRRPLIRRGLR